ncbi:MAG: Asp-tRNA(Asn)/Glu-tRNA(Gln) amidotransferase subunit GatC [Lentisphaeria bacterium]|nr:Asp-tRNA(Asn)/Glu-tRNA(Gln) amidotransferase subunit GatC [Lentisphaeria bacterium]
MSESDIQVAHIAKLARLQLTPEEEAEFQTEIEAILSYVDKLQNLNVDGVEPTAHATQITNVIRDDVSGKTQDREKTLANAPDVADEVLLKVPAVLGGAH